MNQKGLTPIILILGMLLVLTAFGGFYYFKNYTNIPPTNISAKLNTTTTRSKHPILVPSATSSSIQNTVDTSSWKTYNNAKQGYSIKLPPNLVAKQGVPDTTSSEINFPTDSNNPYATDIILIEVKTIPVGTTIPDAILKNLAGVGSYDPNKYASQPINLGGLSGLFYESVPAQFGASDAFVIRDNILYSFRLDGGVSVSNFNRDEVIFKQILSTFKFIN